jgi:O-antigen/teichoic acid export membrane protein
MQIWIGLMVVGLGMLAVSQQVFVLWIGDAVQVPFSISVLMYIWVILNSWNLIFVHFLNGTGKVGLQLRFALVTALLNIPLAVYLGLRIGIEGVLVASIIMSLITVLVYPLQYRWLMNGKAKGVFNE